MSTTTRDSVGRLWDWLRRTRKGQSLPFEIYVSLVESLFLDHRSLLVGSVAASITALVTAWKTGEEFLYFCSAAILMVACARALDMRAFRRCRPHITTIEEARTWEHRYVVGAAAHVALLGTWCLASFIKTSDPFVHLISFSLTLAYLIGVSGRNFASSLLVKAQIICAGVPMTIALFSVGGIYYTIFAFVLVPFFATLKFISDRLRRILLEAVIANRDVSLLAARFDTALNNMPHGLCMFDAERRLAVANQRLAQLLNVAPWIAGGQPTAREFLLAAVEGGTLASDSAERVILDFETRLAGLADGDMFIDTQSGGTLALTFHPMSDRGAIVLFEDITDRKLAEAKINRLVRYDTLTGLPNRTFLRDQLEASVVALRRRGPFAVHVIDLDDFQEINDTLGHMRGDELLCIVADRLRETVRGSHVVARFGADEFVILQTPLGQPAEAGELAERITAALGAPFLLSGHEVVISISIGIALAPRDGAEAELLLKNADMALHRAKADGGRAWRFFEPDMDVSAQARRSLQLDLRTAIATKALDVHYQPLYDMATKRITTCEALARWQHPTRGMVSPSEFIPVAEDMGLIEEIGDLVLRKACVECAGWPDDIRVAVNFSPYQFRRGDVVETVREALAASGLSPCRLEIEITETAFLDDTETTRQRLDQLRRLGVRISLDDFGTGYSSLSYLHSYPLDKVKIDRSFLLGLETTGRPLKLLQGVARLSAELGLLVVIEGVETEGQLAIIASEPSIGEVQGFLFSAAVPADDIRRALDAADSGHHHAMCA